MENVEMDSDKLDFLQEIDKLVEEETGGTCRIYNQDVLFENPPGISYERFLNMDLGLSNKPFISQLKVLFTNLANADTTSKPHVNDILKAILSHVSTLPCNTIENLQWMLEFTAMFLLLKNKTDETISLENDFVNSLSEMDIENITYDSHLTKEISKSLFAILEDDFNLIEIVKRIFKINRFCYYVSVTLLLAALQRSQEINILSFRISSVDMVKDLLRNVRIENYHINLGKIFSFLNLLSTYQSLVLLRRQNVKEDHGVYESEFSFTKEDIDFIKKWLVAMKKLLEFLLLRYPSETALYTINTFIEADMLSSLEEFKI